MLKTKLPIESLLRKQEEIYKTNIRNKTLTEIELIALLIQFPNLMQRPIVLSGNHAVIADPPETINNVL